MNTKLLSSAAAAALLLGTAATADLSIMYRSQFASLIEPGIEAYEAATGEAVERIPTKAMTTVSPLMLPLALRRTCCISTPAWCSACPPMVTFCR